MPTRQYYKQFMIKRVARIYPAYIVGLLLFWIAASVMQSNSFDWLVAGLDVTLTQSYIPALSMQWYGGGAWSVATEFFFYILFPFLLPLLLRVQSKKVLWLLVACGIVLGTAPGLYYSLYPNAFRAELPYTFPPSRLPEFICGILLGLLVLKHGFRVSEWTALIMVVVTALYLAKFGTSLKSYPANNFVAIPTIMALISVLASSEKTRFLDWLNLRPFVYLGRVSFSFYIIQLPLIVILEALIERGIIRRTDFYVILPFILINTALAAVLYQLVEKKAHSFLLNRFLKKTHTPPPLAPSLS
jgi:peptidoglycan/LPS O-acetylase OafA/YrhL